ncbi:MAG: hypothetical protein EZS28_044193, partial [Streblomastix strix]
MDDQGQNYNGISDGAFTIGGGDDDFITDQLKLDDPKGIPGGIIDIYGIIQLIDIYGIPKEGENPIDYYSGYPQTDPDDDPQMPEGNADPTDIFFFNAIQGLQMDQFYYIQLYIFLGGE